MKYPEWICSKCGDKYGKKSCGIAYWHPNKCDVCGKIGLVTEPRDFGHLKDDWENEQSNSKTAKA